MDAQQLALEALLEPSPLVKGHKVQALSVALRSRSLETLVSAQDDIQQPGIPTKPQLVHPRALARRGTGTEKGRISLLHAIAHIEFNAINLALDAVVRFSGLPIEYYHDWIQVAIDEARHFDLINKRLLVLGASYGDHDAHHGLWDMALRTADSPLDRMAMVPRIMEARGLDVTPGMIKQLKRAGDQQSADLLSLILQEEVAHVEAGSRWFQYLCEQQNLDPEQTWFDLVRKYLGNDIRCPINLQARSEAGFKESEIRWLQLACQ